MTMHIYSIAIVGITGYAGRELERILASHTQAKITGRFASTSDPASGVAAFSLEALRATSPDVVILATEHEFSLNTVPTLLNEELRVLDMSGAFRLKDPELYPQWYGFAHTSPELLSSAVYGLPEFFAAEIGGARL